MSLPRSDSVAFEAKPTLTEAALRRAQTADRNVIEIIAQYSREKGLTPRLIKVEEIYAPSALES